MQSTEEKVQLALRLIDGKLNIYTDRFKKIYPFTTENIGGYQPLFKLNDKVLLTVGSSLDQTINASLAGCKDITILDLCPYAKEYFNLKKAAIKTLSKKEFERFLMYKNYYLGLFDNNRALALETFDKIGETLYEQDPNSYIFWKEILTKKSPETVRRKLFSADEYSPRTIRHLNPYLQSEDSYIKTRTTLDKTKVTFLEGDITTTALPRNYDNIYLSNIACHLSFEEIKKLVCKLQAHLIDDGQLLVSYLYGLTSSLDFTENDPDIYDIGRAMKELPKPLELKRFESVNGPMIVDGVLVYKKKK